MPTLTGPLFIVAPPNAAAYPDVVTLVDNSGGTAAATLAAQAVTVAGVDGTANNAASKADVDTQLAIIRNAISSLAAAVNALSARGQ